VKYGRANLFRQALQSFQEALKHDPEYPEALYGLGRAHLDLGHYSEAIVAFQTVLKLDPNASDAYSGLGEAYAKLKEEKPASPIQDNFGVGERVAITEKPADMTPPKMPDRKGDLAALYKVGAGDVLDIRMAGSPNQDSTLFTVSSTGMLEYPILGQPLKVLGLTTNEISENIGAEMRRLAIGRESDPQVGVRDYNSHTILVSGLVKEPGTKILRREAIPLYVVLADAQPLPEASQVTVISQHSDKARVIELSDAQQTSMLVLPGDVVSVAQGAKQFFYVGGEVKAPGEFSYHKGLSLTQAILAAGGVTPGGEKVELTRGAGDGLLSLNKFKLKDINNGKVPDQLIEPGDRIMVLH
jgi:polysaccharide export outer membrane protein